MKIVVIGGTGMIGTQLVSNLSSMGHDVIGASPTLGVNAVTREGLAEALVGIDVVVDVANSPSFEATEAMDFFHASCTNILEAEAAAGVGHHIVLSAVGTDRLQGSGYFRAKMKQENLIRESNVPYTIIHSTQFFEFLPSIIQHSTRGETIHMSPALIQPVGSAEVAKILTDASLQEPVNNTVEIAGPEKMSLLELTRFYLHRLKDTRRIVSDSNADFFGALLNDETLIPGPNARLGAVNYESWLNAQSKIL